jgi:hypothetical protein
MTDIDHFNRLRRAGVPPSTALDVLSGKTLEEEALEGARRRQAATAILALGARDRPRPRLVWDMSSANWHRSLDDCDAAAFAVGRLAVRNISGDARTIHQISAFQGAVFQVASQFNMLEMIHPQVTPQDGVARYEADLTQGPACAIAAGAATIYRNYFVPIGDQTADRQLDGLHDVGIYLANELGAEAAGLWRMENGYALCEPDGLRRIAAALETRSDLADEIRQRLVIGLHWDVEVTDVQRPAPHHVSQAFCSALPVA